MVFSIKGASPYFFFSAKVETVYVLDLKESKIMALVIRRHKRCVSLKCAEYGEGKEIVKEGTK